MADETRAETEEQDTTTATAAETPAEGEEKPPEKLAQQVEMRDIGPCKKHIKVSVDRAGIDKKLDEHFSKLRGEASVPGFRPGKVPRKMIERHFHKDVFDQVKAEVLLQSLEQLADENDVAPLSAPDLNPTAIEIPKDGPLVYEFDVEVRPDFELPNYRGLKLRRPVKDFTDADVEREKRRLLAPFGQLVPKADGGAEEGDYLTADITTRDDDRLVSELKETQIRIEPRLVFKDAVADRFGEQVHGARPGDTRVVDLTMSERVAEQALRGKTVRATFDVKDLKTVRLPELTHELLHEFGVHSEEQLQERVRVLLQWRLTYRQRQVAREQVLGRITASTQWQLPEDLLRRQARKALARKVMEMRNSGISDQEIQARRQLLEQDALSSTAQALKEHFVLQKIAETEKIDVNDDDLNEEIDRIAEREDESPRRVRARLEKEDLLDALAAELIERKALDLILESAEYEDVPLGKEEDQQVTSVEEQAVPGDMPDPMAETANETGEGASSEQAAGEKHE